METIIFHPEKDTNAIAEAAAILRRGGLLGIPTETVYGLGADGLNEDAVRRIFEAKGRPQDNPLILHVPDAGWLERCCVDVPETAYALAEKFWPGPLTMILPRRDCVPLRTTGGLDTVGVRCPDHPVTRAIIQAAGVPVAAPSGNTSGRPSPTCARHMMEDMMGKIDGIVDGGDCAVGVESTIIDLTVQPPRLLRPGGLPLEELEAVLGTVAVDKAVRQKLADGEKAKAPGMKYRHYAPRAAVTVVTGTPGRSARWIRAHLPEKAGVICFDEYAPLFAGHIVHRLGAADDKLAQAQHVFDALRTFDDTDVEAIFAQCPDESGLGLAVSNRLKRRRASIRWTCRRWSSASRGPPVRARPVPCGRWKGWADWCWTATPSTMSCCGRTQSCAAPSPARSGTCSRRTAALTGRSWAPSYSAIRRRWRR